MFQEAVCLQSLPLAFSSSPCTSSFPFAPFPRRFANVKLQAGSSKNKDPRVERPWQVGQVSQAGALGHQEQQRGNENDRCGASGNGNVMEVDG